MREPLRALFRLLLVAMIASGPAYAQTLDVSIPTETLAPFLKSLEIVTAHRPYQGAASLKAGGGIGFELGVEAILVRMPDDLIETLGGGLSVLPMAKLHVGQALTPMFDVSGSGLWYRGTYMVGAGLKIRLWAPEEGPTLSVRMGYNFTNIDFSTFPIPLELPVEGVDASNTSFVLKTHTINPQIILSKRMSWAEPYIALGLDIATGHAAFSATLTEPITGLSTEASTTSAKVPAFGFEAITGVAIRIPLLRIKIAFEGAYSSLGMPSLGTQIGFSF